MEKKTFEVSITVTGNWAEMVLADFKTGTEVAVVRWEDKRDLSDQILRKLDSLCKKRRLNIRQIVKVSFACDSPYAEMSQAPERYSLAKVGAGDKCGFTSWQTGSIIAEVMNFALKKVS